MKHIQLLNYLQEIGLYLPRNNMYTEKKFANNYALAGSKALLYNVHHDKFFDTNGKIKDEYVNNIIDIGFEWKQSTIQTWTRVSLKKTTKTYISLIDELKNYNDEERIKFIEKEKNLKNVKILTEVKKNQLILINHQYFFITGTNELVNATQLKLSAKNTKNLFNLVDANKHNKLESIDDANFNEVIQELICKLQEPIYSRYNSIGEEFETAYEKIQTAVREDKLYIIEYLLAIMSAKPTQGYIKPELAKEIGTTGKNKGRINSATIDLNKTTFISTSVTGLFSKKYKL